MTVGKANSLLGAGVSRSKTFEAKDGDFTRTTEKNGLEKSATLKADGTVEREKALAEGAEVEAEFHAVLAEREASLFEAGGKTLAEGTTTLPGGVTAEGSVTGPRFSIEGSAQAGLTTDGLDIDLNLNIDANLIEAGGSLKKEFEVEVQGEKVKIALELGADGSVGINGELQLRLHVGTDGVSVSALGDGFAGARGALTGSIQVDVNDRKIMAAELSVEARAGVGAGASFEGDLSNFRASAYAAAGVGLGVEIAGGLTVPGLGWTATGLMLPGTQGW